MMMPKQNQNQKSIQSIPNIPPEVWGPSVWRAIHFIALGFPSETATELQKESYRIFFRNLDGVLPCFTCADNYREHLEKDIGPVEEAIKASASTHPRALFDWTVQLHNVVSRSLGKPGKPWTPEQALSELMKSAKPNTKLSSQPSIGGAEQQQQQERRITVITAISLVVVLIAVALAYIVRWVFGIRE